MKCSIFDLEDGNSEIVTGRYCTVRLTARDSYFTILVKVFNNHIFYRKHKFHRSYRISIEHKIMVLKPAIKYEIIWYTSPKFETILINDFWHHSIYLLSKRFSNIIFTEPKITNFKNETIGHSKTYLLFDLLERQKSIS